MRVDDAMTDKKKLVPGVQPGKWGPQSGPASNIKKDKHYLGMAPGERVSAFGKTYYEYRKNRSDVSKKKRL